MSQVAKIPPDALARLEMLALLFRRPSLDQQGLAEHQAMGSASRSHASDSQSADPHVPRK